MGLFDFLRRKKEEEALPEEPEAEVIKPLELPTQPLPTTPAAPSYPLPQQPQAPSALPAAPMHHYEAHPEVHREEANDLNKSLELIATKLEVINAKLDRIIDLLSTRRY